MSDNTSSEAAKRCRFAFTCKEKNPNLYETLTPNIINDITQKHIERDNTTNS